jgi:hypothetical protein
MSKASDVLDLFESTIAAYRVRITFVDLEDYLS